MEFDSTGDLFGYPGRLTNSVEPGAGRRRVFAVGNYVNQRLLQPLHNWLMPFMHQFFLEGGGGIHICILFLLYTL
ncbi:hypothetical protein GQ457_01G035890 [Hibiscus cannabinus]